MAVISCSRNSAVASSHQMSCGKGLLSSRLLYTRNEVATFGLSILDFLWGREIATWLIASFYVCHSKVQKNKKEEHFSSIG